MRISGRSDGGIATGSMTPNRPSRAQMKPAWPRRTRLVSVEITGRDLAVLARPRGVAARLQHHERQPEGLTIAAPLISGGVAGANPAIRQRAADASGDGKRR